MNLEQLRKLVQEACGDYDAQQQNQNQVLMEKKKRQAENGKNRPCNHCERCSGTS